MAVMVAVGLSCLKIRLLIRDRSPESTHTLSSPAESASLLSPVTAPSVCVSKYGKLKVAVVDDSAASRRIALAALKRLGVSPDNIQLFEDGERVGGLCVWNGSVVFAPMARWGEEDHDDDDCTVCVQWQDRRFCVCCKVGQSSLTLCCWICHCR